eukprot:2191950-Pleurochrysis_carterae.AAC.1
MAEYVLRTHDFLKFSEEARKALPQHGHSNKIACSVELVTRPWRQQSVAQKYIAKSYDRAVFKVVIVST